MTPIETHLQTRCDQLSKDIVKAHADLMSAPNKAFEQMYRAEKLNALHLRAELVQVGRILNIKIKPLET